MLPHHQTRGAKPKTVRVTHDARAFVSEFASDGRAVMRDGHLTFRGKVEVIRNSTFRITLESGERFDVQVFA